MRIFIIISDLASKQINGVSYLFCNSVYSIHLPSLMKMAYLQFEQTTKGPKIWPNLKKGKRN